MHLPPSEADHEPLLTLLGNISTNTAEKIPGFVKYNAFRWLRDSGFQVIPFAMSNVTALTPAVVRAGILEYGKYERSWPKENAVGMLEFAPPPRDWAGSYRLVFYSPAIQMTGYSLMILPLTAGTALLVYSYRHRRKVEQTGCSEPRDCDAVPSRASLARGR